MVVTLLNWNCAEQANYSDGFTEVKVGPKVATVSESTLEPSWQEFRLKSAQGQGVNFLRELKILWQDKTLRDHCIYYSEIGTLSSLLNL